MGTGPLMHTDEEIRFSSTDYTDVLNNLRNLWIKSRSQINAEDSFLLT